MKKRKIFYFLPILTAIALIIAVPFSAAAIENTDNTAVAPDYSEEKTSVIGAGTAQESDGKENVFDTAYAFFAENADKLFSLLAFIASLLLTLTYKKGLLPTLSRGIGNIASEIEEFRDNAARDKSESGKRTEKISEELSALEDNARLLSDKLCSLEEKLDGVIPKRASEERLGIIMSAQVDMLYDIFMASALPQYRKDDVGKRISEMREELLCLDEKKN